MTAAPAPHSPPRAVHIETPHLYMRTLTEDDASDRWAAWLDQDEVRKGVNLGPQKKTKADIVAALVKHVRGLEQKP